MRRVSGCGMLIACRLTSAIKKINSAAMIQPNSKTQGKKIAWKVRIVNHNGQSLVEFALTLPATLLLILLSVRVLMIMDSWYMVVNAADVGARAAAITGDANDVRRVILANFPGVDPTSIDIIISPDTPTFNRQPTITPIPPTKTPAARFVPTATPDPLTAIDPRGIPDYPVRVSITYHMLVAGPLVPAWEITLSSSATARLETQFHPLPTLSYF